MKIRALRVTEVGLFRDPVAVEGFSGALDVLAGPNELGKSTLFRAIRAVFLVRHTTTGRAVEDLASHGGPRSPVIEADFEAKGQRWRITKTYGNKKNADLVDLSTGRVSARGPDAEEALAQLIGTGGVDAAAGRFGLLWVGQQQSLRLPTPDFDPERRKFYSARRERATLQSAIAAEVDTVAGGPLARRVAERVEAELQTYLQPKRRLPRAASRYEAALRERHALNEKLEHMCAEQEKAAARLDRLDALMQEQAASASPERLAALKRAQEGATYALAEAEKLAGALAHALSREQVARLAYEKAAEGLVRFERGLAEVEALGAERAELGQKRAELERAHAAHTEALAEIDAAIATNEERAQRLEDIAGRLREIDVLLAAISAREAALARAGALVEEIGRLETALAANPATGECMRRLADAEQAVTLAEERTHTPAAVDLIFDLEPAAAGRVRLDGKLVSVRGRLGVDHVVRLEIAGIGVFVIAPADADERQQRRFDAESAKRALAEIEAVLGAKAGAPAKALAKERQTLGEHLAQVKARLAAEAPEGVAAIEAVLERERWALAELKSAASNEDLFGLAREGSALSPEGAQGERQLRRMLVARLSDLRTRRDEEKRALGEVTFALERGRERDGEIGRRLEELTRWLDVPEGRVGQRERLAREGEAALSTLKAATQERVLLAQSAPSHEDVEARRTAHAHAAEALLMAQSAAARLAQDIAALEGEIRVAGEAEIGPEIARLCGAIAALDQEVAHHERDIAALELLKETLAAVASENRNRFLKPITRRLQPYLVQVFPDAEVVFNQDFGLDVLTRGGRGEAIDLLSDGTQEQLAVLVRLGFGRLLAETGMPAPVILDDALVYSDDERITRMFAALRSAAEHHQVIVFTCRSAIFAQLGGARLSLEPWHSL